MSPSASTMVTSGQDVRQLARDRVPGIHHHRPAKRARYKGQKLGTGATGPVEVADQVPVQRRTAHGHQNVFSVGRWLIGDVNGPKGLGELNDDAVVTLVTDEQVAAPTDDEPIETALLDQANRLRHLRDTRWADQ